MFFNGTAVNRGDPTMVGGRVFWPSPLYAMHNLFDLWKGGFKFRVKIAKTKFHTGRLILGFNPCAPRLSDLVALPLEPSDLQYKSVVWDLREGNVMEFECPYIAPTSYLDHYFSFGTFFISVLDPLAGPDTVSSSVEVVVEVAGMDDFELAVPVTAREFVAPLDSFPIWQSGSFEPISADHVGAAAEYCIGERLNSIKQLIMRAQVDTVMQSLTSYAIGLGFVHPSFFPDSSVPTSLNNVDTSYTSYFGDCFAMARGGFHVDIIGLTNEARCTAWPTVGSISLDNMPIVTENATACHVKLPYYNMRSRHLTTTTAFSNNNTVTAVAALGTSTAGIAYKRAAEDFQFGYFLGFGPLVKPFTVETPLSAEVRAVYT